MWVAGEGEHRNGSVVPNGDSTYVMTKEHAAAFEKVLVPLLVMRARCELVSGAGNPFLFSVLPVRDLVLHGLLAGCCERAVVHGL